MTSLESTVALLIVTNLGWVALGTLALLSYFEEKKLWDYVLNGKRVRDTARVLRYMHKHHINEDLTLKTIEEAQA